MDSVVYYTDRQVTVQDLRHILDRDGWRYEVHPYHADWLTIFVTLPAAMSREEHEFRWYLEPVTIAEFIAEDNNSPEDSVVILSHNPVSFFEIRFRAVTLCSLTRLVAAFMDHHGGWMCGPDEIDYDRSNVLGARYTVEHTGEVFIDCGDTVRESATR
jgi:hypothetical protein